MSGDVETRMRLDLWLWRTRFYKTRTQAAEALATSGARIERDGEYAVAKLCTCAGDAPCPACW